MRKLPPKKTTDVPISLALPNTLPNDMDGRVKRKAKTTHERREELIQEQRYIYHENYDSRYKEDDTKKALDDHYKSKCAFCEEKAERLDVEHYRPKSVYYWLAYSWDNLLLACPTCNQDHKGIQFDIDGKRAKYRASDLPEIHNLCQKYNKTEKPQLLHPEYDNFEDIWIFDCEGIISSNDIRGAYTIKTCGLDRKWLNDARVEILNDFVEELKDYIIKFENEPEKLELSLNIIYERFAKEAENESKQFLAFRDYALKHIIPIILQELLT